MCARNLQPTSNTGNSSQPLMCFVTSSWTYTQNKIIVLELDPGLTATLIRNGRKGDE